VKIPARFRSLRGVLAFWYSAVLIAAFLVFGVTVYVYLRYEGQRAIERGLRAQVTWISDRVTIGLQPGVMPEPLANLPREIQDQLRKHLDQEGDNYAVLIRSTDGREFYAAGDRTAFEASKAPAVSGRTMLASIDRGPGGTYRVASLSRETFEIHVAVHEENIRRVLNNTKAIMFLLAPFVLLVGATGGWYLAGAALRPIDQVISIAERRNAQNMNERMPERDVDDELGRLIRTLNRTADRVTAAFEQIKNFSWNVAHELKTPLTILRGEAELALAGPLTPAEAERLSTTYLEETVRLSGILDDLLTLAQADAGQAYVERKPVRVEDLVEDLRDDAAILASEKSLIVELLENAPGTVLGDLARLRRLFRSLISNAVRYTDADGAIRIRSRRDGDVMRISIQDSGIGIPAESLPLIFDRFYRADPARSRDRGGSGLGLSLARWIAESHGGTITAESTVGAGSTFTVTLPLAPT
jgi:heavy metal sensor kinase